MYRLLIVEDEWIIRDGLCRRLDWNSVGFSVAGEAGDGDEALELYRQNGGYDAILTDIRMPVMDGIEMTRILRESGSSAVIVFLSGHDDFAYAQKGIRFQVFDYILKPTKDADIYATFSRIRTHLDAQNEERGRPGAGDTDIIPTDAIERAKGIINKRIGDRLTLAEVATEVFLCPTYFSVLFKRCTGKTFIRYLTERRMDEAHRLLAKGVYKVYEVSQRVGYDDFRHFSKVFFKSYGITPTDFMKKR